MLLRDLEGVEGVLWTLSHALNGVQGEILRKLKLYNFLIGSKQPLQQLKIENDNSKEITITIHSKKKTPETALANTQNLQKFTNFASLNPIDFLNKIKNSVITLEDRKNY